MEGQESANQGRPGSPALSKPGRLGEVVFKETRREERGVEGGNAIGKDGEREKCLDIQAAP